jgi:predicted DNA-binding transcriptional regulator AlpA
MKKSRRLIPDAAVCDRYGVHISTLYNWDRDPKLNFPKPIRIRKRKHRYEDELDAFDRARAAERDTNAA